MTFRSRRASTPADGARIMKAEPQPDARPQDHREPSCSRGGYMPGYVITAVFEVGGGKIRLGRDVLAAGWGRGHRFSYCDGRMLTLVADVTAADRAQGFELVLSRAERLWVELGGEPLHPPVTLRVQTVVPEEKVVAGAVGRGPDGLIAGSAARVAARLRATRAALADLEAQLWPRNGPDDGPSGTGTVALDEPRPLPEIEALLPPR
jgi:hypothetical protein